MAKNNRVIIFLSRMIFMGLVVHLVSCSNQLAKYPDGEFKIMVLADTQTSDDEDKYQRLDKMLKRVSDEEFPDLDFVVVAGDFVSAVYGKDTLSENRLARTVGIFEKLKIPYYSAMGNHDYKLTRNRDSDAPFEKSEILKMERIWKDHTGFDPYFSIIHKGWNFIFLNSMRGRYLQRAFDDEQMTWFSNELNKGLPTILIFHHPIKTDNEKIWGKAKDLITEASEPEFYALCRNKKDQIKGIFVGHGHRWVTDHLFDEILVHETKGFADSEGEPVYTIIGFQSKKEQIDIAINPMEN